jgi:hypothetical protein
MVSQTMTSIKQLQDLNIKIINVARQNRLLYLREVKNNASRLTINELKEKKRILLQRLSQYAQRTSNDRGQKAVQK